MHTVSDSSRVAPGTSAVASSRLIMLVRHALSDSASLTTSNNVSGDSGRANRHNTSGRLTVPVVLGGSGRCSSGISVVANGMLVMPKDTSLAALNDIFIVPVRLGLPDGADRSSSCSSDPLYPALKPSRMVVSKHTLVPAYLPRLAPQSRSLRSEHRPLQSAHTSEETSIGSVRVAENVVPQPLVPDGLKRVPSVCNWCTESRPIWHRLWVTLQSTMAHRCSGAHQQPLLPPQLI